MAMMYFPRKKRRKRPAVIITTLGMVLSLILAAGFGIRTIPEIIAGISSDRVFSDMVDSAVQEYVPMEKPDGSTPAPVENAVTIDWEGYAGTDIIGWFQMDDISYPLLQGTDNEYYLHHLPDGTYNINGSLFLLAENNRFLSDPSNFIYGHNMSSGRMFGKLKNYATEASKGQEFYIYLPDGTCHIYRFFSVNIVNESSDAYTWSFSSEDSFLSWQNNLLETSLFDTGGVASADKKFVTLSTCDGWEGTTSRLIICGEEVRVETLQEPASWYESYLAEYSSVKDSWTSRSNEIAQGLSDVLSNARQELQNTLGGDS